MGMGKPSGDYVEQLTEPGGWTEADEDELYEIVGKATEALRQFTFSAFDPWRRERSETFDGGTASATSPAPQTARSGPTPGSSLHNRTATPAVIRQTAITLVVMRCRR